jgi:lysozyme
MEQYKVIVPKLNVRKAPVADTNDKSNIITTVNEGLILELEEVLNVPNPSLGKWYRDKQNQYYWAGGLMSLSTGTSSALVNLPINLPKNYKLGVDVSHHNEKIDWNAFKNRGVSFVYIKISEGVGTPDVKAKENALNAVSADLKIGYYHFCRPDSRNGGTIESDARAEANEAISIMTGLPNPHLPLVLDLEDQEHWDTPLLPKDYLLWITTFINLITEKTGVPPIIYSRKEYLDRKLPKIHDFQNIKLWMSYYPAKPDCKKVGIPNGWNDWSIWQYTENGILGTNTKIDINIMKDDFLL